MSATAQVIHWNPRFPAHRERDGDGIWLFGANHPVRLAGAYALAIAEAVDGRLSLSELDDLAYTRGLDPMKVRATVRRWIAQEYLVAGSEAGQDSGEHVAIDDDVVLVRHLLDVVGLVASGELPPHRLIASTAGPNPTAVLARCPRCLAQRLQQRRPETFLAMRLCGLQYVPASPSADDTPRAISRLVNDLQATKEADVVLEWDCSSGEVSRHVVVPVPGCPDCDPDGTSLPATDTFTNETFTPETNTRVVQDSGGYRTVSADDTWNRHEHLVSPLVGMVPWVAPLGAADLHVFEAGPNLARMDMDLEAMMQGLRARASGKGTSPAAARTGALAEALERASIVYRGDEPHHTARFNELDGAIHPNEVQLFSAHQLEQSERQWQLGTPEPPAVRFQEVPRPFDTDRRVEWTSYRVLGSSEVRWLPSSITWLWHPDSASGGHRACSNGVAAGNTLNEATLQGLLELIERDAVALWWYPRVQRAGFDCTSSDDPRIATAWNSAQRPERSTWVLDLTSDVGITTCVAVSARDDGRGILYGFGAHLNSHIAVTRALAELGQIMAAWESSTLSLPYEQWWFEQASIDTEPWLTPSSVRAIPEGDTALWHEGSLDDALAEVHGRLRHHGFDVLVANCTRSDIGLPVVRTVVPGLRHFWNRFAPGRLYDIPIRNGWVVPSFSESDLNPWVMFL